MRNQQPTQPGATTPGKRKPLDDEPVHVVKKEKPRSTDLSEGSVKHVVDTGLPPGIEPGDLSDPNRNRPKGVPNGDNS